MRKQKKQVNDFEKSNLIYFKEIGKYKPLSISEEFDLWKDYKYNNNIESRNKLITANLKFVTSIAQTYKGRGLSLSDLISEGNVGLIKAMDKFDGERGNKIISYSVWWIRQTILEAIEKRNGIEFEALPSDMEYCNDFDYSGDEVDIETNVNKNIIVTDVDKNIRIKEQREALEIMMASLTERERYIISHYTGINDNDDETLEEIGLAIGLTKERVRQIKDKAMTKMRSAGLKNYITADIYR